MLITIICATLGPLSEVESLIQSLHKAINYANNGLKIEFILIDQSQSCDDYTFPVFDSLIILHLKNSIRGLSLNRSIGLTHASGEWILILDSDCTVDNLFFHEFFKLIKIYPEHRHFIGRVLGEGDNKSLFRKWPKSLKKIYSLQKIYYCISVNNIFKLDGDIIRFDESFGLGSKFGSCEDLDFFIRLKTTSIYSPSLIIYHPNFNAKNLPNSKVDSYSYGFGAFCAKHIIPYGLGYILFSLALKFYLLIIGRISINEMGRFLYFRILGFCSYFYKKRVIK